MPCFAPCFISKILLKRGYRESEKLDSLRRWCFSLSGHQIKSSTLAPKCVTMGQWILVNYEKQISYFSPVSRRQESSSHLASCLVIWHTKHWKVVQLLWVLDVIHPSNTNLMHTRWDSREASALCPSCAIPTTKEGPSNFGNPHNLRKIKVEQPG